MLIRVTSKPCGVLLTLECSKVILGPFGALNTLKMASNSRIVGRRVKFGTRGHCSDRYTYGVLLTLQGWRSFWGHSLHLCQNGLSPKEEKSWLHSKILKLGNWGHYSYTFDLVVFKVILGSFSGLVSKCRLTWKCRATYIGFWNSGALDTCTSYVGYLSTLRVGIWKCPSVLVCPKPVWPSVVKIRPFGVNLTWSFVMDD